MVTNEVGRVNPRSCLVARVSERVLMTVKKMATLRTLQRCDVLLSLPRGVYHTPRSSCDIPPVRSWFVYVGVYERICVLGGCGHGAEVRVKKMAMLKGSPWYTPISRGTGAVHQSFVVIVADSPVYIDCIKAQNSGGVW